MTLKPRKRRTHRLVVSLLLPSPRTAQEDRMPHREGSKSAEMTHRAVPVLGTSVGHALAAGREAGLYTYCMAGCGYIALLCGYLYPTCGI